MTNCVTLPQPSPEVAERPGPTGVEKSHEHYELFHQAIVERSPAAWDKLYGYYWPQVVRWVQQEAAFAMSGEEAQHFANRAFEKMWRSLTPAKFGKFINLSAILKYLRLCVRSVVVDEVRRIHRCALNLTAVADTLLAASGDVAQEYSAARQRELFWLHIQARLKNAKEQRLIYYRFVLGLKPKMICEQDQETFATPAEVSTLLQNILARLRRDPALQGFMLA